MKFKDFQGPDLFSRTFQAWKMEEENSKTFRGTLMNLWEENPADRHTDHGTCDILSTGHICVQVMQPNNNNTQTHKHIDIYNHFYTLW